MLISAILLFVWVIDFSSDISGISTTYTNRIKVFGKNFNYVFGNIEWISYFIHLKIYFNIGANTCRNEYHLNKILKEQ